MSTDLFKGIVNYFFLHDKAEIQDGVSYYILVIAHNIMVSCCGVFDHSIGSTTAIIGYNIVSYRDVTMLALTTFKTTKNHLDSFISDYGTQGKADLEYLINYIAFSKSEEPLISPSLWRSLTEDERLHVRQSLRPPALRESATIPRVVKLNRGESASEPMPAMVERFFRSLSQR
jgi:hypothetical protein